MGTGFGHGVNFAGVAREEVYVVETVHVADARGDVAAKIVVFETQGLMLPIEFGIGPERSLLDSSIEVRDSMFPMDGGMLPLRRLFVRSKYLRLDRFPMDSSMLPLKLLLLKSKYVSDVFFMKRLLGMGPIRWLWTRTKTSSRLMLSIVLGIDPSRLFESRNIWRKSVSLPNSDGMGPVKFFRSDRVGD
ncbi:hypothetical protein SASPL_106713 [Salvia splendens]|uniref:Uncharacterized protein n=1 Tax=Salvia splendens TaxID=180675 RepID=A0A8X8YSZ1_SALSN|nr:hypothetical protein SASPL_106713 [Salvia splendens]